MKRYIFIISICLSLSGTGFAQIIAPGGVNNATPVVWLKPETYNPANPANDTWTNRITVIGGVGNFLYKTAPPAWKTDGYNFHPSVVFSKSGDANARNRLVSANSYNIAVGDNVTAIFVLTNKRTTNSNYLFAFSDKPYFDMDLRFNSSGLQLFWENTTAKSTGITDITGIITVDNANIASNGLNTYLNGKSKVSNLTVGTDDSNATLTLGAASNSNGSGYGYEGDIQEVILLKADGDHLTGSDLRKIHSYLGIKYGITINDSATLINSSGNTVWDSAANIGYNNHVFGIGRDDVTDLYQKQSHSATNKEIVMFLGNQSVPQALNSDNNGTLSDGQFLVMGSSSSVNNNTTTSFSMPVNTEYANGVILNDALSFRSQHIYKAQLTGISDIAVNFKLNRSDYYYVLVSTDASFTPATTKAYPVVGGMAYGVEISSSYCYVTFAGRTTTPSGVTGDLRLWLNASDLASFSLSSQAKGSQDVSGYGDYESSGTNTNTSLTTIPAVQQWKDLTRDITYEYIPGSASRKMPVFRDDQIEMNYHPSVHFWGVSGNNVAFLKNQSGLFNSAQPSPNSRHTAIFVVNNAPPRSVDRSYYMGFGHDLNNADYGEYDPDYGIKVVKGETFSIMNTHADNQNNSSQATPPIKFNTGATSVVAYRTYLTSTSTTSGKVIFNIDGQKSSAVTVSLAGLNMNKASTLGISFSDDRQLRGLMSEIIIFEDTVSSADMKKIESYLAIKYGVTLRESPTVNYDYQFSNNNIYWNGKGVDSSWHHNVAAIIRDDEARLHNRQSHSTGAGSILHIGVAGTRLGEDIEDIGDLENDMEAVVWGSNGAVGTSQQLTEGEHCGEFQYVFNRIWKVRKHTLGNRSIELLVGAQNNGNKTIGGTEQGDAAYYDVLNGTSDVVMLVADHPDKLNPDSASFLSGGMVIPMNYVGGENQCRSKFPEDADTRYITFAHKPTLKGCADSIEFSGGNKEFRWTQWTRQNYGNAIKTVTKQQYDLGDDIKVTTTVDYGANITNPAYYPHVVNSPAAGSLRIDRRRGNPTDYVTVTIDFNHPVIPNFYLSDLDGWNGAFEQVSVTGECGNRTYSPKLSYAHANGEAGSWYKITGNTARVYRRYDLTERRLEGRVNVAFSGGITRITIKYSIENRVNSSVITNHLYISPITVRQVPLPPPTNEDGLAFTKDVNKREITTCETPEYLFEITNANCESKLFDLYDTLQAGLKWDPALLMLDSVNQENQSANGLVVDTFTYNGRHVLKITSLEVPSNGRANITAPVVFMPDAVAPGTTTTFYNHASIIYNLIESGASTPVYLFSVDRYHTNNRETPFTAEWKSQQAEIQLEYSHSPSKFGPEDVIDFTITTVNSGTAIDGAFLDIYWEYGDYYKFAYVPHSFVALDASSDTLTDIMLATDLTPQSPPPLATDTLPWLAIAGDADGGTGFTLPAGVTKFKFQLKAPAFADFIPLEEAEDIAAWGDYSPLNLNWLFSSADSDPCLDKPLANLAGDTIVLCSTPKIAALNDTAVTVASTPVIIDVLANDDLGTCDPSTIDLFEIVAGYGPTHGSVSVSTDTIVYTPAAGHFGIDSLDYRFGCNSATAQSRVYIMTLKPHSASYIACEGVEVTVGVELITGVTYKWYRVKEGGTPVIGNTVAITKSASAEDTCYVEATYNGIKFPRYPIYISLGDCGVDNPSGCAAEGTVIFKEDFGGNEYLAANPGTEPFAANTDYNFVPGGVPDNDGEYSLYRRTHYHYGAWHVDGSDHTYPADTAKGYMALFNAGSEPGLFYEHRINDLCPNTVLYFSTWLANMCYSTYNGPEDPDLRFELSDSDGNVLAEYYTGTIPRTTQGEGLVWKQYGFQFNNESGADIVMRIYNHGKGGSGNDFVMDDVEIRFCAPPVTLARPVTLDTTLCQGSPLTFAGSYTDDGTLGNALDYRWEHNTGDVNDPAEWSPVGTQETSNTGYISSSYTINSVALSDTGYYRLAVANAVNIDNYNCRAMSDIIRVRVAEALSSGTVSADQAICYGTKPASLTSTPATGGSSSSYTYEWQQSTDGSTWVPISAGDGSTTTTFSPVALTQTTRYRLKTVAGDNVCDTAYSNAVTVTVK
ncbi:MAG: hypothetical protein LBH60_02750, partial [Prevotellaceae bacterium]|nr:hypothetical protein [Prevotellaceae bacterium]